MTHCVEPPRDSGLIEALKLESAVGRSLFEHVRTPVVVLQLGLIEYVNPAFCELFKIGETNVIALKFEDMINSRSKNVFVNWLLKESLDFNKPLYLDFPLEPPSSEIRWINAKFVRAVWDNVPSVLCFLVDVEERKRSKEVEEQLRQAQKMEAVGRLAGGVAHDMNNVLGAIMGFASVMHAEMPDGSQNRSDVDHILSACQKGRNLMLNLLGFARKGKYRLEYFTLNAKVLEVVDLLKHTIPKKIRIETNLSPNAIEVHGDPTQIHHALMNICINAVDAMGNSGKLAVTSDTFNLTGDMQSMYPDLKIGTYARLQVKDTGSGMDSSVIDMAFEPFFTTKPMGHGSGLGLPMVYGTVKNHGGAVILESTPNEGTIVTVLLPGSKTTSGPLNLLSERRTPSELNRATILLVDDEEMIRDAGKRLLEKLGYRVILAEDGRDGLRRFVENKENIAAVMLDLVMPVMDGEETLVKMKKIDSDIPILLASGYSKEEKAEELITLGADGFMQKPFDLQSLKNRLNEILQLDK